MLNSVETIDKIFDLITDNSAGYNSLSSFRAINLFFEPSTRTHYSFKIAEQNLGMKQISFTPESSSIQKGESFYDTVKVFENFGVDVLVIRHSDNEYFQKLKHKIHIPIINAGAGTKSHPTQTLLDLYTIKQEFGSFKDLTVGIIGDVLHSRVANSSIKIMQELGMKIVISGPPEFIQNKENFVPFPDILKICNVIIMLRIQHERHKDKFDIEDYNSKYGLNSKNIKIMKPNTIIMHPGPYNRGVEITDEIIESKHSRIFTQFKNGVIVRMATIRFVLQENISIFDL
ncbi:MAG: aspartate carbamoyltransferase catalytic subunit [Candidatus Improbicoccus devescovinae]|nr:MAG: aspartate carbamoyltransferase catalytic subunit [Candidatus Improbicoccus devescovinae]